MRDKEDRSAAKQYISTCVPTVDGAAILDPELRGYSSLNVQLGTQKFRLPNSIEQVLYFAHYLKEMPSPCRPTKTNQHRGRNTRRGPGLTCDL